MTTLTRIKVWFLGPRDYPEQVVTLAEHMVRDFPHLVAQARTLNPAVPIDAVVHSIWRLGSRQLQRNLERHIPVKVSELPHASAPRTLSPPPPSKASSQ
jgi:hypothetical protein